MRLRCLTAVALVGLVLASPRPTRAGDTENKQPVIVMRVRSIQSVFDNVRLLARLAGKEELGRQVEGIIKAKAGPNGLEGIDLKRPVGFYINVGEDLNNVAGVAMIPISDEKAFLSLLENVNFPAKKGKDGAYSIEPNGPLPFSLEFRFAHKYAYFTAFNIDAVRKGNLVPPVTIFPSGHMGLASMTIRIDLIPDVAKSIALSSVDDFFAREKEKKQQDETEKQREFIEKAFDVAASKMAAVIKHGQTLNTEIDIDNATNQIKAAVSLTPDPKSKLAVEFVALGKTTSLFGALVSGENALSGLLHVAVPTELRVAYGEAVEDRIKQILAREKNDVKREQVRRLLKSLEPTLKAGEVDATVVLRGPSQEHTYTVVAGMRLQDGLEVEKTLRQLLKDVPPAERALIQADVEMVGEFKVHRINAQATYDAKTRKALGDNPIFVAFRPDAIVIGVGPHGLAAVKEALMAEPKATAPARVQLAVARLATAFAKTEAQKELVRKVFAGGNAGEVRIAVEGGARLRLSVTADLSVLQFIGQFYLASKAE